MKRKSNPKLGFRLRAELAVGKDESKRHDVAVVFSREASMTGVGGRHRYVLLSMTAPEISAFAESKAVTEIELTALAQPLHNGPEASN